MNRMLVLFSVFFCAIAVNVDSYAQSPNHVSEFAYFGEQPPGLTPTSFEPKILSPDGRFEGGVFSPDMKEFYFTRKNDKYKDRAFFVIRYQDNHWGKVTETDIKWPIFSADGNTMYNGKQFRKRTKSGWSEPENIGDFLNEQAHGLTANISSR